MRIFETTRPASDPHGTRDDALGDLDENVGDIRLAGWCWLAGTVVAALIAAS
jgi:hypothetical protein